MKKLVLILILFLPFSVHAKCKDANCWCITDECKELREQYRVQEEQSIKEEIEPQTYHKSLWVSAEKGNIFYIYRFVDGPDLIQVGIIDEKEMVIKTVENLKITGEYRYFGENKKIEYIEENFPNITPLEIYKKP